METNTSFQQLETSQRGGGDEFTLSASAGTFLVSESSNCRVELSKCICGRNQFNELKLNTGKIVSVECQKCRTVWIAGTGADAAQNNILLRYNSDVFFYRSPIQIVQNSSKRPDETVTDAYHLKRRDHIVKLSKCVCSGDKFDGFKLSDGKLVRVECQKCRTAWIADAEASHQGAIMLRYNGNVFFYRTPVQNVLDLSKISYEPVTDVSQLKRGDHIVIRTGNAVFSSNFLFDQHAILVADVKQNEMDLIYWGSNTTRGWVVLYQLARSSILDEKCNIAEIKHQKREIQSGVSRVNYPVEDLPDVVVARAFNLYNNRDEQEYSVTENNTETLATYCKIGQAFSIKGETVKHVRGRLARGLRLAFGINQTIDESVGPPSTGASGSDSSIDILTSHLIGEATDDGSSNQTIDDFVRLPSTEGEVTDDGSSNQTIGDFVRLPSTEDSGAMVTPVNLQQLKTIMQDKLSCQQCIDVGMFLGLSEFYLESIDSDTKPGEKLFEVLLDRQLISDSNVKILIAVLKNRGIEHAAALIASAETVHRGSNDESTQMSSGRTSLASQSPSGNVELSKCICGGNQFDEMKLPNEKLVSVECQQCRNVWIAGADATEDEIMLHYNGDVFFYRTPLQMVLDLSKIFYEPVADASQLKRGDHIIMRRGDMYDHHAILVADLDQNEMNVIHWAPVTKQCCHIVARVAAYILRISTRAGLSEIKHEKIDIPDEIRRVNYPLEDDPDLVVARAYSLYAKRDEQKYSVTQNNCETLATYCKIGKGYSIQGEALRQGRGLLAGGLRVISNNLGSL